MATWVDVPELSISSEDPKEIKSACIVFLQAVSQIKRPDYGSSPQESTGIFNCGELMRQVGKLKEVSLKLSPEDQEEVREAFSKAAKQGVIVAPARSGPTLFATRQAVQAQARSRNPHAQSADVSKKEPTVEKPAVKKSVVEKPAVKKPQVSEAKPETPQAKRKGGLEEALGDKEEGLITVLPGKGPGRSK